MKTYPSKKQSRALTLFEVLIVITVVLALAVIILPQFGRPRMQRARGEKISCINQLKQVGLAFRIWQGDNNDKFPMSVSITNGGTMELVESGTVWRHFQVMSNELNTPKILICPADSERKYFGASIWDSTSSAHPGIVPFTNNINTSFFIGVDATDLSPMMFLAGDRNLAVKNVALNPGLHSLATNAAVGWTAKLHVNQGNVLMADASVQQFTSASLPEALIKTGVATNRLSLP